MLLQRLQTACDRGDRRDYSAHLGSELENWSAPPSPTGRATAGHPVPQLALRALAAIELRWTTDRDNKRTKAGISTACSLQPHTGATAVDMYTPHLVRGSTYGYTL